MSKNHKLTCTITIEEKGNIMENNIQFKGESNGSMIANLIAQLLIALDTAKNQYKNRGELNIEEGGDNGKEAW